MNEQIKQLYLRAVEYSNGQMTPGDTREFFAEKFADLIVNECYNRAEEEYRHSGDEFDKGVLAVMNSIEKLFRS